MDNGTVNWGRRQTDFLTLQRTRMRRVVRSQPRMASLPELMRLRLSGRPVVPNIRS
jgi:hypothetical protein